MKPIERHDPSFSRDLTRSIKEFWTRNVNAERIVGRPVTLYARGEQGYFDDLERQRYRSHRHLVPWIESLRPGARVLELGCGVGLDSYRMARLGLDVTALDLTEVAVRTARMRFLREGLGARFLTGSAERLPLRDGEFDYVYSFGVLHHASDTQRCIQEVHRVLKPGGEARIMLYHRRSLNEFVHRVTRVPFEERDQLCPVVRRFTRGEVRELFRAFSTVEMHLDYLFGEGYGALYRLTPQWLYGVGSRALGWHIMIRAVR